MRSRNIPISIDIMNNSARLNDLILAIISTQIATFYERLPGMLKECETCRCLNGFRTNCIMHFVSEYDSSFYYFESTALSKKSKVVMKRQGEIN